jgi:hypothetical protein
MERVYSRRFPSEVVAFLVSDDRNLKKRNLLKARVAIYAYQQQ